MPLNFAGKNLQSKSFQNQNLTGADFSYSDIRGANFTNTVLKGANFNHARAGLEPYKEVLLYLISLIFTSLFGVSTRFSGGIAASILGRNSLLYRSVPLLQEINLAIVLAVLAILFIFIARRGITTDLVTVFGVIIGALILCGALASAVDLAGIVAGDIALRLVMRVAWDLAGTIPWALAGVISGSLGLSLYFWSIVRIPQVITGILILGGVWAWGWSLVAAFFQPVAISVDIAVAIAVVLLAIYIVWRVFAEDKKFAAIESITITIAARGTSFRNADLTDADFTQAQLRSTDFSNAILTRTNFHLSKHLKQAKVDNTILINPIRDLVVTKRGAKKSYTGCNLKGANLAGADLSYVDLTAADVSEATLAEANLSGANLIKTQALQTNFEQAILTGACIEAWNIDSNTQLTGVICDYVYLLDNQRERRPSSGIFALGEFSKLFQDVLHTVDFIFRNGIDWQAFMYSFRQLQIENEGTELSIRSVENKGDGVVVVRVDVPKNTDKEKIHSEFTQNYQAHLKAVEARYEAELKSKDKQVEDWKAFAQLLASRPVNVHVNQTTDLEKSQKDKLVILKLGKGDFNTGFPVTFQMGVEGTFPSVECTGELPPNLQIPKFYSQWKSAYRKSFNTSLRLEIPETQVTNVSRSVLFEECQQAAENLRQNLNLWLNSEEFRPIKERMLEKLNPTETVRIIVQTDNSQLQRLPWILWDLCDRYSKAEIALSIPSYEHISQPISCNSKVRILAILGDSTGINVSKDQALLERLPDAFVKFLVEPQRQQLNDQLWDQPWDILFFAGHSSTISHQIGQIHLNKTDNLTIPQLKNALLKAIEQGLKLAIFNSCDGLGLAVNLADLHIPQMIFMRESVPDQVATEFLKNFLLAFSQGKSLYTSVRCAREKLQGLEDRFPCATWFPVIYQNPGSLPPTWQDLHKV